VDLEAILPRELVAYARQNPGKLAYGESPPPGSPFGPNADLDFDVHIVQIVPNAALMNQGGEIPGKAQQAPQPEAAPNP
jgi:FKBP-type peptidyl-prolyl cis-trans isomerase FkpA